VRPPARNGSLRATSRWIPGISSSKVVIKMLDPASRA
jgi:hypothetical protein